MMARISISLSIFFLILLFLFGCSQEKAIDDNTEITQLESLKITSPAFEYNTMIPMQYTCQGEDINPEIIIKNMPEGTVSLALVVDDPDAPGSTCDHWVMWNIPVLAKINENSVPEGAIQGKNAWKTNEYRGPCPPKKHRYFFKLYALDISIELDENADKKDLEDAMKGHILEKAELMGLYENRNR